MKIYCSTFGKKVFSKKVIPIEVGASERSEFVYDLHDDSGDNISKENKYFGELTGIYWIWKNCKFENDTIIGFCHYNKGLQISEKKAKIFLDNNRGGWITLKPCKNRDHPVDDEVKAIEDVLKHKPTKYYEAWTRMYDSVAAGKYECCRAGNMFITTYKEFSEYCDWLFDILFEMRNIVGDKVDTD